MAIEEKPGQPQPRATGTSKNAITLGVPILVIAVIVAALNLRPSIASIGPVLDQLLSTLGASSAFGGLITAIPGLAFFAIGLSAVSVGKRMGLSGALTLSAALLFVGLAVRPWVSSIWLFLLFTALSVAGIALGNVLLPAWIKVHGGRHTVVLMMLYSSMLALGGGLGPATAFLISDSPEASAGSIDMWRWAIAAWAITALVQLVVWGPLRARIGFDYPKAPVSSSANTPIWKSPTAIALAVFFGVQSMNAYVLMGWMPKMLIDAGISVSVATAASMLVQGLGIIGGLLMPPLIARLRTMSYVAFSLGCLFFLGYLLMILIDQRGAAATGAGYAIGAAFLLGVGGFCFPMAIALIPARTRSHELTARLSGFVQPIGYIFSAVGPFLVGVAAGTAETWTPILIVLLGTTVVLAVLGLIIGRPTFIDDELADRGIGEKKSGRIQLD
ncbi:MFS transporter [Corynebacterium amycolatum]|uniref:MFS transporter n=1 Tax=Corynebacterium amycolatum TaxID=43765 RepID=UPI0012B91865|nr:MFS transporter [Corynebacterium amycolatum]KAA9268639.1 MFS transporter [Corynebacterium amycolatum]MBU5624309.1 MFS transporter [Corynebacterium amycolatum]